MKKTCLILLIAVFALACFKRAPKVFDVEKGYFEKGLASWYGDEFRGKPTASGEIFDPDDMTAAHKTLPLGTIVKVKNLDNGKEAELKINDRGPFVRGRIIDCSRKGAKELGYFANGTAKVKIEVVKVGKGRAGKSPTTVLDDSADKVLDGSFTVQTGAFKEVKNAKGLKETLRKKFGDSYVAQFREFYRVRVGHFKTEKEANTLLNMLSKSGYEGFVTRND